MKQILVLFAACSVAVSLFAAEKQLVNRDKTGLGLQGYDPVAFFTEGKPVKGTPDHTALHNGTTYRFASAQNKAQFEMAPKMYEPAFGGYCAFGVSKNVLVSIDPEAFQIVDGRLFLQYSKGARKDFSKDIKGNTVKADANWPVLVQSKGKNP
jgi:YHS domain-containing protein